MTEAKEVLWPPGGWRLRVNGLALWRIVKKLERSVSTVVAVRSRTVWRTFSVDERGQRPPIGQVFPSNEPSEHGTREIDQEYLGSSTHAQYHETQDRFLAETTRPNKQLSRSK